MQVLTGKLKGKKLKVPKTGNVRPTTGRIKKSIFDKLGDITGFSVLDLFAGTGNLGIESLSKNAAHATFVENGRGSLKILGENIRSCGFEDSARTLSLDFRKALRLLKKEGRKFDLIFIDPPYSMFAWHTVSDFLKELSQLLSSSGVIVIEHNQDFEFEDNEFILDTRKYGGTNISFFRSKN